MSNRSTTIIPIPGSVEHGELVPLVNERLTRIDQEIGRVDARIDAIPAATVTPTPTPTVQDNELLFARATAGVAGGAGYANVTGCSLTLTRDGKWIVHATIRAVLNAGAALMVGRVLVTPTVGAPAALTGNIVLTGANAHQATVSQQWEIPAGVTGDVLDLQVVGVNTATDPVTPGVGYSSTISALWVSP